MKTSRKLKTRSVAIH